MKTGIIDRAIFAILSKTCVKELIKEHLDWDGRAIRRHAKKRFFMMLKETPDIGSFRENCMKINLVGGAVWFSIFEAVEELYGRMPDDLYFKMCNATFAVPVMRRRFQRMPFFNEAYQDKYARKIDKANRIKSEYNWTSEFKKGAPDFATMRFTTCGLCALARRTGHMDILPIMCRTDYTVAKLLGVNLHRDRTLATGDSSCDYLYTRPDSEIEQQWLAEHPVGTFISK